MFKNKSGEDSPIPKFMHLKIQLCDGVESLTTLEEGEFKVPIDGCINEYYYLISLKGVLTGMSHEYLWTNHAFKCWWCQYTGWHRSYGIYMGGIQNPGLLLQWTDVGWKFQLSWISCCKVGNHEWVFGNKWLMCFHERQKTAWPRMSMLL